MQGFRQAVDTCGFKDLGYTRPKYAWWRNNPVEIRIRLDHALATTDYCSRFLGTEVLHLNPTRSDYMPLKVIISRRIQLNG